jgi:hypothetical protein
MREISHSAGTEVESEVFGTKNIEERLYVAAKHKYCGQQTGKGPGSLQTARSITPAGTEFFEG